MLTTALRSGGGSARHADGPASEVPGTARFQHRRYGPRPVFWCCLPAVRYRSRLKDGSFLRLIRKKDMFSEKIIVEPGTFMLRLIDGQLKEILKPGVYHRRRPFRAVRELRTIAEYTPFYESLIALLEADSRLAEYSVTIETGPDEIALVRMGRRLFAAVQPDSRVVYAKGEERLTAEIINIRDNPFVDPAVFAGSPSRLGLRSSDINRFTVPAGTRGLLYRDGAFHGAFSAGTYAFWAILEDWQMKAVELRSQALEVSGQEILTKDRASIRINAIAEFQVTDPELAVSATDSYKELLYRTVQMAVRQALGTRTLDEVLADKTALDSSVSGQVSDVMKTVGVKIISLGIKDIILPGDIRDLMNRVVEAEKEAQAGLIRRREETAATRSQLNTARLMEDHPMLMRMREMETLEKVTGNVQELRLSGGSLDEIVKSLIGRPEK